MVVRCSEGRRKIGIVWSGHRRKAPVCACGARGRRMLTYLFIYPHSPAGVQTKRQGLRAALELSGMPADEIHKQLKAFDSLRVKQEGLSLVQQEYR